MLTLLDCLNRTTEFFKNKGVPNPKLDAELIISHVLKCQRLQLYLQFERELEEITLEKLRPLVKRRGEREPLQYILGEVEWANLKLKVDKRCLIPRNETEELWELILDDCKLGQKKPARILDLGTGSGALALALKKSFPAAKVVAVEKNPQTLSLALENAQALGLEIDFVEGSWCSNLNPGDQFDLIVSNPPYLTQKEWESAQPEVKLWEPKDALMTINEGFAEIAEIMKQSRKHLKTDGQLWLETGIAHADLVKVHGAAAGYQKVNVYKDHAGRNRFARLG
jgi:release factor glutamine methyltransferase